MSIVGKIDTDICSINYNLYVMSAYVYVCMYVCVCMYGACVVCVCVVCAYIVVIHLHGLTKLNLNVQPRCDKLFQNCKNNNDRYV